MLTQDLNGFSVVNEKAFQFISFSFHYDYSIFGVTVKGSTGLYLTEEKHWIFDSSLQNYQIDLPASYYFSSFASQPEKVFIYEYNTTDGMKICSAPIIINTSAFLFEV